jgi:hypothetical protein
MQSDEITTGAAPRPTQDAPNPAAASTTAADPAQHHTESPAVAAGRAAAEIGSYTEVEAAAATAAASQAAEEEDTQGSRGALAPKAICHSLNLAAAVLTLSGATPAQTLANNRRRVTAAAASASGGPTTRPEAFVQAVYAAGADADTLRAAEALARAESARALAESAREECREELIHNRFRTRVCRNFSARGACPYGQRCMFAHGPQELRSVDQNLEEGLTSDEAVRAYLRTGAITTGSSSTSTATAVAALSAATALGMASPASLVAAAAAGNVAPPPTLGAPASLMGGGDAGAPMMDLRPPAIRDITGGAASHPVGPPTAQPFVPQQQHSQQQQQHQQQSSTSGARHGSSANLGSSLRRAFAPGPAVPAPPAHHVGPHPQSQSSMSAHMQQQQQPQPAYYAPPHAQQHVPHGAADEAGMYAYDGAAAGGAPMPYGNGSFAAPTCATDSFVMPPRHNGAHLQPQLVPPPQHALSMSASGLLHRAAAAAATATGAAGGAPQMLLSPQQFRAMQQQQQGQPAGPSSAVMGGAEAPPPYATNATPSSHHNSAQQLHKVAPVPSAAVAGAPHHQGPYTHQQQQQQYQQHPAYATMDVVSMQMHQQHQAAYQQQHLHMDPHNYVHAQGSMGGMMDSNGMMMMAPMGRPQMSPYHHQVPADVAVVSSASGHYHAPPHMQHSQSSHPHAPASASASLRGFPGTLDPAAADHMGSSIAGGTPNSSPMSSKRWRNDPYSSQRVPV